MKIFISHNWKDKTEAIQLRDELETTVFKGVEVWMDSENLNPGESISEVVRKNIEVSDFVFVLWSENSVGSDGVAEELKLCKELNKRLIPLLLDGTSPESNPIISDTLGINFEESIRVVGYQRIRFVMLSDLLRDMAVLKQDEMKLIERLDEALNYTTYTTKLRDELDEKEKDYWEERVDQLGEEMVSLFNNVLIKIQEEQTLIADLMHKFDAIKTNVAALSELKLEAENSEKAFYLTPKFIALIDEQMKAIAS